MPPILLIPPSPRRLGNDKREKRDEFERYRAYHLAEEKRKQEHERSYMKWRNEVLKPWLEKNPGKTEHDMPLNLRLFPSLF